MNRRPAAILALLLLTGCSVSFVGTHAVTRGISAARPAPREPFNAADKPVFDGTLYAGKPRDGIKGTFRVRMVYEWQADGEGLWRDGGEHDRIVRLPGPDKAQALPPRAQVERIAKAATNRLLCFDLETNSWQPDRAADVATHAEFCRSYATVLRWARAANPYVRIGAWNDVPGAAGSDGREDDYWRNWLAECAPLTDYTVPALYVTADTNMDEWREQATARIERALEARKPVYFCVNVDGPPEKVAEAVRFLKGHPQVAGIVAWAHPGKYDAKAWREAMN